MKSRNIGFGVFLLAIGVIWLMISFGHINVFSMISSFIVLWPLILVVIGFNVIFKRQAAVRGVTWFLFFALLISYSYFVEPKIKIDDKHSTKYKTISEKMDAEISSRKMGIKLGATKLEIDSDTEKLFDASVPQSTEYKTENGKEKIYFKKESYIPVNFEGNLSLYKFHLNKNVDWDLDIDAGAISGRMDLSKLKVSKLKLDLGFGSMDINLGNLSEKTEVVIDAGFSSVNASVPKSSGVKIKIDSGLGNSNIKDLDWEKKDKYYISPNYDEAENKIDVEVDTGLSSFNINLY